MSHWAQIDENNKVVQVLVCDDNDPNQDQGYKWLCETFGGRWIQTSYNTRHNKHQFGKTPLRGNFAGIGYTYDEVADVFCPPQPNALWVWDENICDWKPPAST